MNSTFYSIILPTSKIKYLVDFYLGADGLEYFFISGLKLWHMWHFGGLGVVGNVRSRPRIYMM